MNKIILSISSITKNEEIKIYKPLTQRVYACDSFTYEIYCALKLLRK